MRLSIGLLAAAAALGASSAAANPQGDKTFTVKNESGKRVSCAVKRDGSARTSQVLLKAGQVWTSAVSDSKDRRVRCEGAYSQWQRISAGRAYSVVEASDGRLMVR